MTAVWVYAEPGVDGARPASLELLTKARSLGDVDAVAFGAGASASVDALGAHGARRVFLSEDPMFDADPGRPAAHVLAGLIDAHAPDLILFPTSYAARDTAGRLQAQTGSALMSNATDVLEPRRARTEIFGGSTIVDVELGGPSPDLVLVRPRSFESQPVGGSADVVQVDASVPETARGARVLERHEETAAGPRLEEARLVIAGGRGLGGPDAFAMLDELAAEIRGAAVGASRAAVDAGWVPYAYQIGQTGTTVKPDVYLGVGISGALQHLVGMKGSSRIVAINKDADAPLMKMADLGVVGDLFAIVPALTEEVRRRSRS